LAQRPPPFHLVGWRVPQRDFQRCLACFLPFDRLTRLPNFDGLGRAQLQERRRVIELKEI
jgi:hypothetical protein